MRDFRRSSPNRNTSPGYPLINWQTEFFVVMMNKKLNQKVRREIISFVKLSCWLISLIPGSNFCGASQAVAWGAGTIDNPNINYNDRGQSIVPADLTNAVLVAGGWGHSLALKANGALEAWGDDSFGQLNYPVTTNYLAMACGYAHSVALRTNGTVIAFGDFSYDQTSVPSGLTNVVAIACGFYHSLALKADGTLSAWGGQGSADVDFGQGTVPQGISNIVAIAAGGDHNLVLKSDGTLFAWGENDYGETNIPAGLSNVIAVAAGGGHNLVLKNDGTVIAWGLNNYGQTNIPAGLSNVVSIAAGGWHNLALKRDGTVVAWGAGSGLNTNVDFGQNIVPAGLTNVIQVAAGTVHSLALVGTAPPSLHAALTRSTFGANGFSVMLPTLNGHVYQLEYKNSLSAGTWQPLSLQAGTGRQTRFTDASATPPHRFYRVLQW